MYAEKYMAQCDAILRRTRETQRDNIIRAAQVIADSIARGGMFHFAPCMHVSGEPIARAGGLVLINPIRIKATVERPTPTPHPKLGRVPAPALTPEVEDHIAALCDFVPGDVLLTTNNAGLADTVVGLAMAAKRRGVTVIAITSTTFGPGEVAKPPHPSGKRLCEVADIVIDNCGMVGDAVVEIPGIEVKACPTAGVTEIYIIWALTAQLIHELVQRGLKPHVYMFGKLEGAKEHNAAGHARFRETGL